MSQASLVVLIASMAFLLLWLNLPCCDGLTFASISKAPPLYWRQLQHKSSRLQPLAVVDYAAEIENAVGTEIYSPIFQSGLLLFASGVISSVIAAFLVNSFGSWEEIENDFEAGKQSQLIDKVTSQSPQTTQKMHIEPTTEKTEIGTTSTEELKDIDI